MRAIPSGRAAGLRPQPQAASQSSIPIAERYDTLAQAMTAEGLHEVRWYQSAGQFTVKLIDGRSGRGKTIREAIDTANHERLAA